MKRGFTLIELLAVIVILAIIALIATPIVLNIINETKESAILRSAEMYLDAVEQGIMRAQLKGISIVGTYNILEDGILCNKVLEENETCPDKNKLVVEVEGETPSSGSITIENGKIVIISLVLNDKGIIKNNNEQFIYLQDGSICGLKSGNLKEIGSKYICEVKEGKIHTFYLLSNNNENDSTYNLIMDRNICSDGTEATSNNTCLVNWNSTYYNANGPVVAFDYLYSATKDWKKVPNIQINYIDSPGTKEYGYGSIVTNEGITKISNKDGNIVNVMDDKTGYENLKARLPIYEELKDYDETNDYLYDNLDASDWVAAGKGPTNSIPGIKGYWTISSFADISGGVWGIGSTGYRGWFGTSSTYGIRPVITVKL